MKKYLLTFALLGASFSFIGQVVAQDLPACTCHGGGRGPQVQCDMKKDKVDLFKGNKLGEQECIWACHCTIESGVCVTSGPPGETLGHCMPY